MNSKWIVSAFLLLFIFGSLFIIKYSNVTSASNSLSYQKQLPIIPESTFPSIDHVIHLPKHTLESENANFTSNSLIPSNILQKQDKKSEGHISISSALIISSALLVNIPIIAITAYIFWQRSVALRNEERKVTIRYLLLIPIALSLISTLIFAFKPILHMVQEKFGFFVHIKTTSAYSILSFVLLVISTASLLIVEYGLAGLWVLIDLLNTTLHIYFHSTKQQSKY